MRLLSLIFRVFEKRQYKRAYLKQMHESLKDYSERTLAVGVYHTPPAIIQPWKSPDKQTRRPKEYHTGQKNQTQTIVLTQVDQISPSTFQRCDYHVHNAYIVGAFLRGTLSTSMTSTSTYGFTSSSSKIATMTSAMPRNHGKLLNGWCR